jgi:hypothetical protein
MEHPMHSSLGMWTKLRKDVAACRLEAALHEVVSHTEMSALPRTVRRYMEFYGVAEGTPKHTAVSLRWTGEFRLAPDKPWVPMEAVQRDTRTPVTRIFLMRARMNGVVPVFVHDAYVDGEGKVIAKLADLVPVIEATGTALSLNELVTWIDDCVHFAPSMLLGRHTHWINVDDHTFDVVFYDCGHKIAARVHVDERGAPVDFETDDRVLDDPHDPKHPLMRGRWTTPSRAWQRVGEQVFPTQTDATWELPQGEFTYARLDLDAASVVFEK